MSNRPPIRVLHVVLSLEPGGMENGLANLANHVPPDEVDFQVVCLERMGSFASRFPDPSRIHTLSKRPGFDWLTIAELARLFSSVAPDIIHTHNLGPLIYAVLARGARFAIPILHGEHGQPPEAPSDQRRRFQRHLFYSLTAFQHTVSRSLKTHFQQLGYKTDRMLVFRNGVDTDHFKTSDKTEARSALGLPKKGFYVGIIGRFGPCKRHLELLEAFQELGKQHPGMHLLMAGGGGPLETEVREKARTHPFHERIHLVGVLEDPRPAYSAIDLLAIPSVNEGLANTMLESMSSGVPVLVNSMACGPEEVILDGKNGIVRRMDSPGDIARSIRMAIQMKTELKTMAKEGRSTVESDWSMDSMSRTYVEAYQRIHTKDESILKLL